MQRIPLNIQTLYADLQQQVETASPDEVTVVSTRTCDGLLEAARACVAAPAVIEVAEPRSIDRL